LLDSLYTLFVYLKSLDGGAADLSEIVNIGIDFYFPFSLILFFNFY